MTLSRNVLTDGALALSPAVDVRQRPISSSVGMHTLQADDSDDNGSSNDPIVSAQSMAADGVSDTSIVFAGPPPGYVWYVQRAAVGSDSVPPSFTNVDVHAGTINFNDYISTLVESSPVPNLDIADESSPIFVGSGQQLTFRFAGGANGEVATARIQYKEQVAS